ncbi:Ribosomal RNA large subunit methyltransferase N [Sandaracinus amylolyticus]|nr:Ribosomal RNA large subunit methyltransferase N [Sandaracinus amylolyticus]
MLGEETRSGRPHLFGMRPTDLAAFLRERGVACTDAEARRVQAHVISHSRGDLATIARPVPKRMREAIDAMLDRAPLELVDRVRDDDDGFVKYLFRHPDGALTEAVRIPLHQPGRFTLCLSSQVGCAMRCVFCATGKLGLTRNLRAWEMVAAFCAVRDDLARERPDARISGAVFMGQGEPFHNYDEVIRAAQVLSDPCGGRITQEAITISTVGLVPQILRYAREGHTFRLIVSLTSAIPEKRVRLLPVAGRFAMEELVAALREVHAAIGKRVTVAWVLMGGVNHGDDEIEALRTRFADLPLRVNLIDLNRWAEDEDGMRRATDDERHELVAKLHAMGIATQRRYSGGRNKHAACGMLAAQHAESMPQPPPEAPFYGES